ncbi:MAG TPA: ParB/RepB/Spo0J family partition protein [Chthoniobacteraceae bacterium]|nr:ParB/RepB/Spo0J family partition protein [Chthoniobacteraceae bacterium]
MKTKAKTKTPAKPKAPKAKEPAATPSAKAPKAPEPAKPITYKIQDGILPLKQIVVVSNIRTDFGGSDDDELMESIRVHGIQTPLWVRAGSGGKFELIAGERRYRAAKALSLDAVPVRIYFITPEQGLALQVVENLQRKNISALDEGRGYKKLLDSHGYSIERLMQELSKSRSYIYSRIKLAQLPKLAIEAGAAGKITDSVLVRIARIPLPEQQMECVKHFIQEEQYNDAPVSDREAARYIEGEYMRQLKGALFDPSDSFLVPVKVNSSSRIHGGACTDCPHRSGNQPDLFDKGRADVCTHPACYALKAAAALQQVEAQARKEGVRLLPPEEAKAVFGLEDCLTHNSRYVKPADKIPEDRQKRTYGQLAKETGHKPVLAQSQRSGKLYKLFVRAECKDAFIAAGHKFYEEATIAKREANAEEIARDRENALREIQWDHAVGTLIDHIATLGAFGATHPLVFRFILEVMNDDCLRADEASLKATIARRMPCSAFRDHQLWEWMLRLSPSESACVLLENALRCSHDEEHLAALAKHFEVDLKAAESSRVRRLEMVRKLPDFQSVCASRAVIAAARGVYSLDRIQGGKAIKTFEWRGLHWTSTNLAALAGQPEIWEVVPKCAFDGAPILAKEARLFPSSISDRNYDGAICYQGGITYCLRGPKLQLVRQPGECQKCGCTEVLNWTKGRTWADDSRRLCTACDADKEQPKAGEAEEKGVNPMAAPRGKGLSPEARERIIAAKRARWSKARGAKRK